MIMKTQKSLLILFLASLMSFVSLPSWALEPQEPNQNPDDSFYEISTVEHLLWLAQEVNSGDMATAFKARLMNDIQINTAPYGNVVAWTLLQDYVYIDTYDYINEDYVDWAPIGSQDYWFEGEFDGNHHTISQLYYNYNHIMPYYGLFGYAKNAKIYDLTIASSFFYGQNEVGAVVACALSNVTIERCVSSSCHVVNTNTTGSNGELVGSGGIVGNLNEECSVTDCMVHDVNTLSFVTTFGGICCNNSGEIKNCLSDWMTCADTVYIYQNNEGIVSNCYFSNGYTAPSAMEGITSVSYTDRSSGRLCYLLNENIDGGVWQQDLHNVYSDMQYPFPVGTEDSENQVYQYNSYIYYNPENGEIPEVLERFELSDKFGFDGVGPFNIVKTSYTRDVPINAHRWFSVYLPFALNELDNETGILYMINRIEDVGGGHYAVRLQQVTEIPACTPGFVFHSDPNSFISVLSSSSDGGYVTFSTEDHFQEFGRFSVRGVLDSLSITSDQLSQANHYYLANDALHRAKNPLTIPPFRAYLVDTQAGSGAAPARFTMSIEDEEATGIVSLEEERPATAHCIDLLGRTQSPSAKGLLIMNHKKLLSR